MLGREPPGYGGKSTTRVYMPPSRVSLGVYPCVPPVYPVVITRYMKDGVVLCALLLASSTVPAFSPYKRVPLPSQNKPCWARKQA